MVKHINFIKHDSKHEHSKKIKLYQQSNMEEVWGVALLPLALGELLKSVRGIIIIDQEITKVFCSAVFHPVSQICFSVVGHGKDKDTKHT